MVHQCHTLYQRQSADHLNARAVSGAASLHFDGGGAFLEFLEGKTLPALAVLKECAKARLCYARARGTEACERIGRALLSFAAIRVT